MGEEVRDQWLRAELGDGVRVNGASVELGEGGGLDLPRFRGRLSIGLPVCCCVIRSAVDLDRIR
jgi:hypothetical protein